MLFYLTFLLELVLLPVVSSQDLSIPSSWPARNTSLSREQQVNISQAALNTVRPLFTESGYLPGWWYYNSAQILWTLAFKDYIAGTLENANVTNAITAAWNENENFTFYSENRAPSYWAMASIYAYRAYNNTAMLTISESVWESLSQYLITEADAAQGSHPLKNTSYSGTCDNKSLAGGLFFSTKPDSFDIYACHTAQYASLSAHLFEITNDTKYSDAAVLAAGFVRDLMIDAEDLVIQTMVPGVVNTSDGSVTSCPLYDGSSRTTMDTGEWLSTTALLADVTGDSQWTELMVKSLAASVKTPLWIGENGVVYEGLTGSDDAESYKGKFIRALYEPWARTNRSDVRDLISAFVNVQASSIMSFATSGNSNYYSHIWTGPPATAFSSAGALASFDVLAAAIGPSSAEDTTISAPGSPSSTQPIRRKSDLPVVLGLTFSLVALVVVVTLVWRLHYRRRHRKTRDSHEDGIQESSEFNARGITPTMLVSHVSITPYTVPSMSAHGIIPPEKLAPGLMESPVLASPATPLPSKSRRVHFEPSTPAPLGHVSILSSATPHEPVPGSSREQLRQSPMVNPSASLPDVARNMTMNDLVDILNSRLRTGPRDADEASPPQYEA